jgi:hypothetical protein
VRRGLSRSESNNERTSRKDKKRHSKKEVFGNNKLEFGEFRFTN